LLASFPDPVTFFKNKVISWEATFFSSIPMSQVVSILQTCGAGIRVGQSKIADEVVNTHPENVAPQEQCQGKKEAKMHGEWCRLVEAMKSVHV
jgi:hypothetical protein